MARDNSGSAETRKRATRLALCAALLELLLERPFEAIQILDLTGRAGIGYATFFRHFRSTHDVLDDLAGGEIRDLLQRAMPILREEDGLASIRALCLYVEERKSLWRPLLTGGAAHTVRSVFARQARALSNAALHRETPVPIDLGTICAAGSTIDALAWWLDGAPHSAEEMAQYIYALVLEPFIGRR